MLKSEHLLYRIISPNIRPRLIDPAAPFLLDLAAELTAVYNEAVHSGMLRNELSEITEELIRGSFDMEIAAGLNKLLLDRCEFATAEKLDYPACRRESFLKSAALLSTGNFTAESLRRCAVNGDLSGDLPDFEKVAAFTPITAAALLHRYNLAQAQGLLFFADSLHIEIGECDQTELRKLLKTIKFFRLLAHFHRRQNSGITVDISGPCSIFGHSAKYALQFANLLPAIVNLPQWQLTAQLRIKGRKLNLKLSQKNELVSHYRNLAGYLPDEIKIYHHSFNEKQEQWQIIGETPFIDGGNQEIIFPDLSFRSKTSGNIFHLELFHRWHTAGLPRRIALLAEKPELPLLLGIDRALVKSDEDFEKLFENAPQVRHQCWLFRDFPGVNATVNALNRMEKAIQKEPKE